MAIAGRNRYGREITGKKTLTPHNTRNFIFEADFLVLVLLVVLGGWGRTKS